MNQRIKHTAHPSGELTEYPFGMPKPEVKHIQHIGKKAMQDHAFELNKVKEGGVCHCDGQNDFLAQVRGLLS